MMSIRRTSDMSKVVEVIKRHDGGTRSIVIANSGRWYCVDTANTWDAGPETMVFRYNRKSKNVTNWQGLFTMRFADMETANEQHKYISEDLEVFVPCL